MRIQNTSNPSKMRQHFLERASPMIDDMIDAALGEGRMKSNNALAQQEVWDILKSVIMQAENPAPLLNLRGDSVDKQVDTILTKVSAGEITFNEAKEYMSLVSMGFDLTKLPELLEKAEMLEALTNGK